MADAVVIIPWASLNDVTTRCDRIKNDKLNHSIRVALQFTKFLSVQEKIIFPSSDLQKMFEGQVPCIVPRNLEGDLELASSKFARVFRLHS
jgi:hypothetical protein